MNEYCACGKVVMRPNETRFTVSEAEFHARRQCSERLPVSRMCACGKMPIDSLVVGGPHGVMNCDAVDSVKVTCSCHRAVELEKHLERIVEATNHQMAMTGLPDDFVDVVRGVIQQTGLTGRRYAELEKRVEWYAAEVKRWEAHAAERELALEKSITEANQQRGKAQAAEAEIAKLKGERDAALAAVEPKTVGASLNAAQVDSLKAQVNKLEVERMGLWNQIRGYREQLGTADAEIVALKKERDRALAQIPQPYPRPSPPAPTVAPPPAPPVARPDNTCAAWGLVDPRYGYEHTDCPVVITDPRQAIPALHGEPVPRVCPCECMTCKRAWEADGRPRVVNGVVERKP